MKKVTVVFLKLFLFVSLVFAGDGAYVFEPGTYYMMDTNVNIRSEPNTHSQKLGKLQPGDKKKFLNKLQVVFILQSLLIIFPVIGIKSVLVKLQDMFLVNTSR